MTAIISPALRRGRAKRARRRLKRQGCKRWFSVLGRWFSVLGRKFWRRRDR